MSDERSLYVPRQFVWCQFPYSESPFEPGPAEHLAYVLRILESRTNPGQRVALCLSTTSQMKSRFVGAPTGVMIVDQEEARGLRQKPFVLNARRSAYLPITPEFFPQMSRLPYHGVMSKASSDFNDRVWEAYRSAWDGHLIEKLGPEAPTRPKHRR